MLLLLLLLLLALLLLPDRPLSSSGLPLWDEELAPLLHHPWHSDRLLDFAELVMGPCVQVPRTPPPHPSLPAPRCCLLLVSSLCSQPRG